MLTVRINRLQAHWSALRLSRHPNISFAAFGHYENLTGYVPGFAFILSFLSPVWTICSCVNDKRSCTPSALRLTSLPLTCSFDCAVSISEEASNAAIAVPYAIIGAIVSAGGLGTLILIILSLTMGTDIAMLNDTDQPLAQIYLMAFGKNGATAIWAFMCIAGAFRAVLVQSVRSLVDHSIASRNSLQSS